MGEIFYWVFNMSIAACIAGSIVCFIGKIGRIPRRIVCFLWIIPFLRMTFPFGVGSEYSFMTLVSMYTTKTVVVYEKVASLSFTNYVMAANSYFPITYKVSILEKVFEAAALIWLINLCALLITFGFIYFITLGELKKAVLMSGNVYISDKITSPAVYGIFKPRIILPSTYRAEDLPYILAHEQVHIKRKDNLRRALAFVITAVHWFNPAAWWFLKQYLEQTELACDELVMSKYNGGQRKAYALTLVNAAESKNVFVSAFGGAKIRVRVERVLSYKKISVFSLCCFATLAAVITYVLITNAL